MAKMDLNEDDEKVNIETIFWSAMDILSDDDKKLPQAGDYPPLIFQSENIFLLYCINSVTMLWK